MAIYVTSDLHLNHANILRMCRQRFNNIDEHNEFIIESYNKIVGKDDLVYILGDVGFSPESKLAELIKRLNGRKILILGNHDRLSPGAYRNMGFIEVVNHPVYYSNNIILSHLPVRECLDNPWVINVHGHVHNGKVDLPNFFNVNVEENDFLPVDMKVFEAKADSICRKYRWERYGMEWYSQWEKKDNGN